MSSIIIQGSKDYLEATSLQKRELVLARTSGAAVSPLTDKDGLCQFTVDLPAAEMDEVDETDSGASTWAHANSIAAGLDAKALAHDVADRLLDDTDARAGALYNLISTILAQHTEADYSRPHIAPSQLDSVGRYAGSIVATVIDRKVKQAMARASDARF